MATSSGGSVKRSTLGQSRAKFASVPDINEGTPMSVCDTSDSDDETEPAESFHRRISTNKDIKTTHCIKEGYLIKHSSKSFQRARRRYFKLKARTLYYTKDTKSVIFNEIDLIGCSVAECSLKTFNVTFQVITQSRNLVLSGQSRKDMEDWVAALKSAANRHYYQPSPDDLEMLSGLHNWNACSHARPTYCNVCREALSGVTSHGLSCEVCKFKAHKRCAVRASSTCKWTTLASIGKDIIEEDGTVYMPHQWLEGNLPVSAKCVHCEKTCGSVLRLQDFRCLWCKATVHAACKDAYTNQCSLGPFRVSVLPPTAITNLDSDGFWRATKPPGTSSLLVFVNSKSGDNRGIKMLRKFKQLLNPAQVFDLMNGGPKVGLRLFQTFESFRVIVAGGDGSIGWVLNEIDQLGLQKECQVGVLPLGTGNDLARVLGWGAIFDDDTQLPAVLEKMEHAQIKMLDRWSIMTYEGLVPPPRKTQPEVDGIAAYEDSVATHLKNILNSDNHNVVISSAKVLCETVKDFVARVGVSAATEDPIALKCSVLNEKLDALLKTLESECDDSEPQSTSVSQKEADGCHDDRDCKKDEEKEKVELNEMIHRDCLVTVHVSPDVPPVADGQCPVLGPVSDAGCVHQGRLHKKLALRRPKDQLMCRANSLKKAFRQIIEHAEKAVDEQNSDTVRYDKELIERGYPSNHTTGEDAVLCGTKLNPPPTIEIVSPAEEDEEEEDEEIIAITTNGSMTEETTKPISPMACLTVPVSTWSSDNDSGGLPSPMLLSPIPHEPNSRRWSFESQSSSSPRSCSPSHFLFNVPPRALESRRISAVSILYNKSGSFDLSHGTPRHVTPRHDTPCRERSPTTDTAHQPSFPILRMSGFPVLTSASSSAKHGGSGGLASSLAGGNFISKVLMANADALCAAVSPLMSEDIDIEDYVEHCVMNNYFGIGLDAKITLDFHMRREEHPEKCRSRTRNMMWYGVIGSKEMVQRNFRNLDQRVQLECDGQRIPLPNLQGIVVLNIPSYMGGINFWGSSKHDDNFVPVSFDDKILEVVAVFGGVQLGISRVINLQHHRIAQCRSVKITIMGEEGVPVQVDGEAWVQPPGYIKINHKNRSQMLIRDKVFEEALKVWREKQKIETPVDAISDLLSEEETQILHSFVEATQMLIKSVKVASICHSSIEQELFHLATQASGFLDRLYPSGQLSEPAIRTQVSDLVSSVRTLYNETNLTMTEKVNTVQLRQDVEEKLVSSLAAMEVEMRKVYEIGGLPHFQAIQQEATELHQKKRKEKSHFRLMRLKRGGKREKETRTAGPSITTVLEWSMEEVGQWLDSLGLAEYQDHFKSHEIQGQELLTLGRQDLKDLGVSKVGHLKRIQQGIKNVKTRLANLDLDKCSTSL